jgi:hypothetical protein
MGVPLLVATAVFCNNHHSVVKNLTAPESVLKKRHRNAMAYCRARKAQAAGIITVPWETMRHKSQIC